MKDGMKLVPFDLIGNKGINQIVDVGNGSKKKGQGFGVFIEIDSAAAARSRGFEPSVKIVVAGGLENFRILGSNYFLGFIKRTRQAKNGINKGSGIELVGIIAKRMQNRFHFKMGIGERVEADFEGAFESGTIRPDMKFNIFDGGHKNKYKDL